MQALSGSNNRVPRNKRPGRDQSRTVAQRRGPARSRSCAGDRSHSAPRRIDSSHTGHGPVDRPIGRSSDIKTPWVLFEFQQRDLRPARPAPKHRQTSPVTQPVPKQRPRSTTVLQTTVLQPQRRSSRRPMLPLPAERHPCCTPALRHRRNWPLEAGHPAPQPAPQSRLLVGPRSPRPAESQVLAPLRYSPV